WSLGDGTSGTGTPPASHTYANEGTYTITLTVRDAAGGEDTKTTAAVIHNAAPVLTLTGPLDPVPMSGGTASVMIPVGLSDPGIFDTFELEYSCNAAAPGTQTIEPAIPPDPIHCTYTAPGVYRVSAEAFDDFGATSGV